MGFLVNDEDFRNAQKDFASFIDQLSELITEKDYTIPELPNKDIVSCYPTLFFLRRD
jgi:hypothetical protein